MLAAVGTWLFQIFQDTQGIFSHENMGTDARQKGNDYAERLSPMLLVRVVDAGSVSLEESSEM